MIKIITSNPLKIKSLFDYNDNFIITVYSSKVLLPYKDKTVGHYFTTYYQDGMELENDTEYIDDETHTYEFIAVDSITSALDDIIAKSNNSTDDPTLTNERENDSIVIACDFSWNNLATKYIKNKIQENLMNIDCLDIYSYMHITNKDALTKMLKFSLQTDFIYPDDPIAFSYALSKILNQVI